LPTCIDEISKAKTYGTVMDGAVFCFISHEARIALRNDGGAQFGQKSEAGPYSVPSPTYEALASVDDVSRDESAQTQEIAPGR
jgi:hypothetical protein